MDRDQAIKLMQDLLRRVTEKKASDLFITAGFPPAIKIDGEIRPQSERALTPEQSATLVRAIMNDRQTKEFTRALAAETAGRIGVTLLVPGGMRKFCVMQKNGSSCGPEKTGPAIGWLVRVGEAERKWPWP